MDYVLRFIIGGVAVSAFAVLGDIFRPKSFAGLFGAAPSIAVATLTITAWKEGAAYAGTEARSMMIGAVALCLYSIAVCHLLKRFQFPSLLATVIALSLWAGFALGLERLALG